MSLENNIISQAREGFEAAFSEYESFNPNMYYEPSMREVIEMLPLRRDMNILDLGTGNGFLAFPFAELPGSSVTGLDILPKTIERNRAKAQAEGLTNLSFVCYDGGEFPFGPAEFDLVISRFALHHMPNILYTLSEIGRVLRRGGTFLLIDPAPLTSDRTEFIERFMQLRKDGHVRFYDETEWKYMCRKSGMEFEKIIYGGIRFSRKYEPEYEELMAQFPEKEIMPYHPVIKNGQISISVPVNHMMFTKQAQKKPEEKVSRPLNFQEERDRIKRAGKKVPTFFKKKPPKDSE